MKTNESEYIECVETKDYEKMSDHEKDNRCEWEHCIYRECGFNCRCAQSWKDE